MSSVTYNHNVALASTFWDWVLTFKGGVSTLLFGATGMHAYHYSRNLLQAGDVIKSNQEAGKTWALVWAAYSEVAKELGLYFPVRYGYAYPIIKDHLPSDRVFKVEAPDDTVTAGNFAFSLYLAMDRLRDFTDRSLPLAERLVQRHEKLKEFARAYFTQISDINAVELISEAWVVGARV